MPIAYTQIFTHETLISVCSRALNHSSLISSNVSKWNSRKEEQLYKGFLSSSKGRHFHASSNSFKHRDRLSVGFSSYEGWESSSSSEDSGFSRKRKVVEHICLLKAKGDLSDEEEKDMLDYLYTCQYQMGGIVAISLGRISDQNSDGYTHALYIRFQRREDLANFYINSFYLGVLKDHVTPYCHELLSIDYKSEVQDDILPIFRKGEEFNFGVEFMLLISVVESALGEHVEDAFAAHAKLTMDFPSLIVQSTQGSNLNLSHSEYTHAAVIRFRSAESFQIFIGSPEYKDLWSSKFEPITQKSLAVNFLVDPVGTDIM